RAWAEPQRRRSAGNRLFRRLLLATLPFPRRFRWALRAGGAVRPWRRWLPRRWRGMLELLPARLPAADPLPE
ncbi:MAG: 2-hydroxy-acid oxidase, partial [Planctomycetales bacterium]|nr:2-hydroxy-acid oxidase [Planctomycetales bacterium]